jgi:hypothetical protein
MSTSIQSINSILVTTDDRIRVSVWTTKATDVPLVVQIKQLLADGSIVQTVERFTANTTTFPAQKLILLTSGEIISITLASLDMSLARGECFARIALQRGANFTDDTILPLLTGYLSGGNILNFPLSRGESASDGEGSALLLTPPPTAAGQPLSYNFGTQRNVRIIGGKFSLTTSPFAINRSIDVSYSVEGAASFGTSARIVQPASTQYVYFLWSGGNMPADSGFSVYIPIPESAQGKGLIFQVSISNLQTTDQISLQKLLVKQTIVPA